MGFGKVLGWPWNGPLLETRSSMHPLAFSLVFLIVVLLSGCFGMHTTFSCYECNQADDPLCCRLPRTPSTSLLFGSEYFIPVCVTQRTQGAITARYASDLPLTKTWVRDGCEGFPSEDGDVQLCYCSGELCNGKLDCVGTTTTPEVTPNSTSDPTGITDPNPSTTQDPDTTSPGTTSTTTKPPIGCPALPNVKIGDKLYDLEARKNGESFLTRCKTKYSEQRGYAEWTCTNGAWNLDTPDFSRCWSVDYDKFKFEAELASENPEVGIPALLSAITVDLNKNLEATVGGDLIHLLNLMSEILSIWEDAHVSPESGLTFLKSFMDISDLEAKMITAWNTCGTTMGPIVFSQVLGQPFAAAFAAFGVVPSEQLAEDPTLLEFDSMSMMLTAIEAPVNMRLASKIFSYQESRFWMELGLDPAGEANDQDYLRMVAIGNKDLHEHLSLALIHVENNTSSATKWAANSRIFGAQLHPNDTSSAPGSTEIVLESANLCTLTSDFLSGREPICLGLPIHQDASPVWSNEHCALDRFDEGMTRCRCSLNVSMVMSVIEHRPEDELLCNVRKPEEKPEQLFSTDTVLPGYAVAAACFLACLVALAARRPSLGPLLLTRSNYAISAVVFYVAMIAGSKMDPSADEGGCSASGGMAMFGLYSLLAWLTCDALCVKQLTSGSGGSGIITGRRKLRRIVLPLICYGLPALTVGFTVVATEWNDYRHSKYCFLNMDTSSVWAFAVFALPNFAVTLSALFTCLLKLKKAKSWDCGGYGGGDVVSAAIRKPLYETSLFATIVLSACISAVVYFSEGEESAAVAFTLMNCAHGIVALAAYASSAFCSSWGGDLRGLANRGTSNPSRTADPFDGHMLSSMGHMPTSSYSSPGGISMIGETHMLPTVRLRQSMRRSSTDSSAPGVI